MSEHVELTILGCGSSGGVPRADGDWGACDPDEPRNRRTRCGLLVSRVGPDGVTRVLVDTSPDLRAQLLAAAPGHIDAVFYTHDHADQTHGIDDLRALVYRQGRRIPAWMDSATRSALTKRFGYIFETPPGSSYPALLDARDMPPTGTEIVAHGAGGPIAARILGQRHGDIESLGFHFGNFAYCNDCSELPEETLNACEGVDLFVVDCLRDRPHPSHAHFDLAMDWIARVRPRRAILTNLHVDLDYRALKARLPSHVEPAFDGMVVRWPASAAV